MTAAVLHRQRSQAAALRGGVTRTTRSRAASFVVIGAVSTVIYLVLYLLLRTATTAVLANLIAQIVSTIVSTAANRRYTVGVTDPTSVVRHHLQMLALLGVNLLLNTAALQILELMAPDASSLVELAVVSASGLLVTALRILTLRRWMTT